jgi:hypothetical protein
MIKFMLITNDPALAVHAESCGVDRIFVDLEWIGKEERQGHLDTLISSHCMADVEKVKAKITRADLLVRLNPLYDGTEREVEDAISAGADLLMLPMFNSESDVVEFCNFVKGRAGVIPLVETCSSADVIGDIARVPGVVEVYIGLNDLHMDMKLNFMFELLANGFVDGLTNSVKQAGIPFGFGGIARAGEGVIPGEMVLGEHMRLGSSSVILSRTFHRKSEGIDEFTTNLNLEYELEKLRKEESAMLLRDVDTIKSDQSKFISAVKAVVSSRK